MTAPVRDLRSSKIHCETETARFWASRARVEFEGQAHIRQVIGPDEYHELVDDNAYTNSMAAFNLERAAEANHPRPRAPQRLASAVGTTGYHRDRTRQLSHAGAGFDNGFQPCNRLIEQFAGYFQLEELDALAHQACPTPIDMCLGAERVGRSKVIEQADVVALSALLWEKWPMAVHEANFRYYEPRTAHASSLSPALHALVAARLGDAALAQNYFQHAPEIEMSNNMAYIPQSHRAPFAF
jgi:kojibiose phosphorylase